MGKSELLVNFPFFISTQGANSYGQLGSGNKTDSLLPNRCVLSDEIVRILVKLTGGGGHSVWLSSQFHRKCMQSTDILCRLLADH